MPVDMPSHPSDPYWADLEVESGAKHPIDTGAAVRCGERGNDRARGCVGESWARR